MPKAKGRVPKDEVKAKASEAEGVQDVEQDIDKPDVGDAEDAKDNVNGEDGKAEDTWQTKAELEAIEAQINAESLVLTKAKASREPPPSLVLPLLPYQKEFLAWAIDQETGPVRGGILADEMGLGKTLQAVSLMVTHPREGQILGPDDGERAAAQDLTEALAPTMKLKLPSHLAQALQKVPGEAPEQPCKDTAMAEGAHFHELPPPGMTATCLAASPEPFGSVPGGGGAQAGTSAVDAADSVVKMPSSQEKVNAKELSSTSGALPPAKEAEAAETPSDTAGTSTIAQSGNGKKAAANRRASKGATKDEPSVAHADAAADDGSPNTPEKDQSKVASNAETPVTGGTAKGKAKRSSKPAKAKKPRVDPMLAAMEQAKECRVEAEEGGDTGFCNATLVVSPVVAAMQWRQEILRYMAPGTVQVVLYHGTNRADTFTRKQLESADVVLTTYSILEVDYRRNVMAPKATCAYCGKKFQPERLKVHLRYFCGPWAEKTEAQAKQQKKKVPWMMRRGGSFGNKGKGDTKTATKTATKGKGSGGASTSKAAMPDPETPRDGMDVDDEAAANDEDDDEYSMETESDNDVAAAKAKAAGKKAATAMVSRRKARTSSAKDAKSAKAVEPKKAQTRKPAAKKQKTAGAKDVSEAAPPPQCVADDAAPTPVPARQGKVTRSRSASLAAASTETPSATPVAASVAVGDNASPVPRTAGRTRAKAAAKVGGKRKRSAAAQAKPKHGPRARANRGSAAGGKGSGSNDDDSGSDTDWAPESEDEQQAEVDAGATESDVEDEATDGEDKSVIDPLEEDDDDEVIVVDEESGGGGDAGRGKGEAKGKKKEVDEEELQLEREVEAAANKMIAKAQRERDEQVQGNSLLHQIRWRRVVLDEAHCIKDRRCNTAQSAFALTARYRWCLTGTPLQNRVNELYSLIRFLRLYPFAHYFADKTQCCSLDFPFKNDLRRCDLCQGSRMSHYCWWNRRIANPIKYNGYEGCGRTAMLILKHQILPKVLLRRTKLMCAADLALPPRTVVLRKDPFDAQEEDFYEALYTQSQAAFGGYVESGTLLNNYAHIFDLLIRLRQAVNHPYLVVYSATGGRNDSLAGLPAPPAAADVVADATTGAASKHLLGICSICHDPLEDGIGAACGHSFCRVCVTEYLDNSVGATNCPTCQRPLTIDLAAPSNASATTASPENKPKNGKGHSAVMRAGMGASGTFKKRSILSRINTTAFQSSTKLEALNEAIQRMLRLDPSAKCIVFSQFTSMLDLAHFRLQQTGVQCVKLEGSMSLDVRNRMIKAFNEDPTVTCFLMSLKAGGVALNLTVASNVMLMDPWWNPAVEQQAQDRIHRLGQYKPITVTRFVIAGTIEERILKLQEKKRLVFEGTVGRDAEALGKLTVDDLRFLFG